MSGKPSSDSESIPRLNASESLSDESRVIGESPEHILRRTFRPIESVCGPLKSASVGIISGEPGVGKSFWTLDMASHIASGQGFESWSVPRTRAVLYVDGEMPGAYIQTRLRMMPPTPNMTVIYEDWLQENYLPPVDLGDLMWQELFLSPKYQALYDVFIFDTVSALLRPQNGMSVWQPEYWYQVQDFNRQMRAANKTVIYVDHVNREGRTAGTSAKKQGIDFEWILEKWEQPHGRAAFHLQVGKDRATPGETAKSSWENLLNYGWKQVK